MPQAPRLRSTGRHMRTTVMTSNRNKWIALLTACMLVIVVGFGGVLALRMRNNLHTQELNISNYKDGLENGCLLYTSPSPRDLSTSRMPSSA